VISPLVSVIVPTHGRPEFLTQAIDSVLGQTVSLWECLVVDDHSPVPPLVPIDPRIRLIVRAENGGPGAARNTGLEHASGEYVVFLDDDDMLTPSRIEAVLPHLGQGIFVVSGLVDLGSGEPPARAGRQWAGDLSRELLAGPVPHLGQVIVERRSALSFAEDLRTAEDVEWWVRMADRGRFLTLPDVGYRLREHSAPRGGVAQRTRLECRIALLQRHERWFHERPAARAHQMYRVAAEAYRVGDKAEARRWILRSLRSRPGAPAIKLAGRLALAAGPGT